MDKNLVIAYQVLKEVQEGTGTMDAQTATHILNMLSNLKDKLHRRNMQIKELKAKLAWITGKTTHKEFINR